ncbi:uncharacterized protein [Misgurnus anguillicaudatus]|uniref:uncharacterized protein isoform X2 n=1 Tax=Misgurnus anguillicaudatus TaxID=75329 RepID=UPI003CCF3BDB
MAESLGGLLEGPCGYTSADTPASKSVVGPTTVRCPNFHGSCRQSNALWEQNPSCSAPCACSSVSVDDEDGVDDSDNGHILPDNFPRLSPWTACTYQERFRRTRTAPPSPLNSHRVREATTCSHARMANEEGLDELRSTLQQAADCIERSSEKIQLLGERMLNASDRMSESMQDNSQAMTMLTHVVEKLQEIVTTSAVTKAPVNAVAINASTLGNRWGRISLSVPVSPAMTSSSRRSHCSTCSSSSSSSSGITLLEQSALSRGRSFSHASNAVSLKGAVKTKPLPSSPHLMTNGSLISSPSQKHKEISSTFGCLSAKKRKKKSKK